MLYEFAITPDVFDGSRIQQAAEPKVIAWMLQGLYENGLIANLQGNLWERHAAQRLVQNCPPGVRDKVLSCLRMLKDRKRLITYPQRAANPADDIEWLDLSLAEHHQHPFHAIVLGHNLFEACTPGEQACIDLDEVLESAAWTDRPQSAPVAKNEAGYRVQLTPLLRHTRMLRIVDPYMFSHKQDCLKTIRLCAELLGKIDQCGIGSQDSFECVIAGASTTRWFLLQSNERERQNAELRPATTHYSHHGSVLITP